ncbi:arsenite methyltransferase [Methanobacterium formicicum]|uniref:arsenite methyltransferase n=1 Tax=Methanobacterium formicicum TaxID=2162 RepID=UPI00241266DE|nr:arsenite methyltransferase [Methanobacterium formicicum]MDG3546740.1 arsenite methyltransferase [Methanobacterium formicicum]
MTEKEIKDFVKERYSKIAAKEDSSSCSCCSKTGVDRIIQQAKAVGYSEEEIKSIPAEAIFGLGCGNPTALAEIKKGETVLDLGSGGGIDVFLAANKVGESGKVIGVDMTEKMVETALENAKAGGYHNVEFKLGEIENLPLEDNSVDLVISNCVINLTPDKSVAYREVYRVLKEGGRILISDIVTEGHLPDEIRKSFQAWSECIAGAMEKEEYMETIRKAGFGKVEVIDAHFFTEPGLDERLKGKLISIQIKAIKTPSDSGFIVKSENNDCGCEGPALKPSKTNETSEGCGCSGETILETPEIGESEGCGCEGLSPETTEQIEENDECSCGCGGEFPDESLVENPKEPVNTVNNSFLEDFEKFARAMGIVNIGYTRVNPELVNTEEPIYTNAIVLTLEMGEDIIETPPGSKAQELNDATYKKMGNITYALSDFIRSQGFATQVAHPYGSMLNFSPLGQEAGLGWIGQSGLLITPELGPRQKISAILTSIENLPVKTHNAHSWIPEYCEKCGKCIRACPEKALIERKICCGNKEIEFIQARCIGCTQGCTYCIESCPFDEKGYAHVKDIFDRINARLEDRKN